MSGTSIVNNFRGPNPNWISFQLHDACIMKGTAVCYAVEEPASRSEHGTADKWHRGLCFLTRNFLKIHNGLVIRKLRIDRITTIPH